AYRHRLPSPRAVLGRIRHGITHLGRPVPGQRRAGRTHHPQSPPAGAPGTGAAALLTTTSRWNPWQVAAPHRRPQRAIVVMMADRVRAGQERKRPQDAIAVTLEPKSSTKSTGRRACVTRPGLRLRQPRRARSLSMFAFAHQVSPEPTDSNKYLI